MLQAVSADHKRANSRGNSHPPPTPDARLAPPAPVLGNQATLRLMRKCDCGGGSDCDCDMGDEKKRKKEEDSPRTALHRKAGGSGVPPALPFLDAQSQSFFEGRLQRKGSGEGTPPGTRPSIPIGAVDDPLEREADQIADRVMRMPDNTLQAGGFAAGRNSTSLFRKATSVPQGYAPSIVHKVLSSPGLPLDPLTRNFFEPRFGRDLSQVRIHADTDAAQSAQSVQAQAWAIGRHIAFGPGMYSLSNPAGGALLAHELVHTLQQGSRPSQLQRVCDKSAACARPIAGDSGRFGEKIEQEAEAERKKTPPPPGGAPPPGSPNPCNNPRHRTPATSYTNMAKGAGASISPEVSGIFIDACMAASAGGYTVLCSSFPDGTPPGADAAKDCIAVAASQEDDAVAILAKPTLTARDNKIVLDSARIVTHEAQHAAFDANAGALVPPAADCALNTVVFHGPSGQNYNVEFYLSEISAEIAEFDPFFRNFKATGTDRSLEQEEQQIVINQGENILGDIRALRCKCECDTVDIFVGGVFADATKSWPPEQTHEFQRSMTVRIPNIWPRALKI
jgi:hypothetical protein